MGCSQRLDLFDGHYPPLLPPSFPSRRKAIRRFGLMQDISQCVARIVVADVASSSCGSDARLG